MPYCKVANADIYYEDLGTGIPIIMIHGFSPDHRLMSACMEPIFSDRNGWRRIYIDLPGMGMTRDYDDIHNADEMLDAVLSLIESLIKDQTFLLIGESYGGYLARGILAKQKERVGGAAFICPVILPHHEDRIVPNHAVLHRDNGFLATLTEEEVTDFSSNQVVLDEYNWCRYKNEVLAGCQIADDHFLAIIKKQYGFSFLIDQMEFEKPSIFLLGKQDSVVGYKDAFEILDKFPRGTFAVLDRAGHNLQIEQAQVFNSLISEWLDRVESYHV